MAHSHMGVLIIFCKRAIRIADRGDPAVYGLSLAGIAGSNSSG